MNRKLGAPSGAFFGVNGAQSAFESRTSSLMVPLKPPGVAGAPPAARCAGGFSTAQAARAAARPITRSTDRDRTGRSIVPLLFSDPAGPKEHDDSDLMSRPDVH